MTTPKFVSVVLTTYNSPAWLEKVLWGYACQSHRAFEILVADDGSTLDTARLVKHWARTMPVPLRHCWQEHLGFRKPRIVNRAIAQARGDYLIFSDGDCIPRADFVAQHVRLARPGCFLSGGMVRLPRALSQRLDRDEIQSGRAHRAAWLVRHGMPLQLKLRMLACGPTLGRWLDALSTTRPSFNGHNASAWTSDILAANGFDERMEYGGLDRELGERLVNAGLRPLRIRHRAICVHLEHARSYRRDDGIRRNNEIRAATRRERLTRTPQGIDQHVDPAPVALPTRRRKAA